MGYLLSPSLAMSIIRTVIDQSGAGTVRLATGFLDSYVELLYLHITFPALGGYAIVSEAIVGGGLTSHSGTMVLAANTPLCLGSLLPEAIAPIRTLVSSHLSMVVSGTVAGLVVARVVPGRHGYLGE